VDRGKQGSAASPRRSPGHRAVRLTPRLSRMPQRTLPVTFRREGALLSGHNGGRTPLSVSQETSRLGLVKKREERRLLGHAWRSVDCKTDQERGSTPRRPKSRLTWLKAMLSGLRPTHALPSSLPPRQSTRRSTPFSRRCAPGRTQRSSPALSSSARRNSRAVQAIDGPGDTWPDESGLCAVGEAGGSLHTGPVMSYARLVSSVTA
jgi:hypothetical protein